MAGQDNRAQTNEAGSSRTGRWVLAAAATLALGAVGYAVVQGDGAPGEGAVVEADAQQPPVSDVIARLEKRLAENADDAQGWQMLGWAYFQTGRMAEAATAFRRATTLEPDNAEYHSMLGEALVLASKDGKGLPADARAAFEKALSLDPSDPRARYFAAVALDLDGKHEEAIEGWFDLLADTPADAPYAGDVRQVIAEVAQANGIDVANRLASAEFAPPTGGMTTDGAALATGAIPGPTQEQMRAAQSMSPGDQDEMIRGMVDGLEAKLADNPRNAEGWIMLMRSRNQLGDVPAARRALNDGLAAFAGDSASQTRLREAAAALGIASR